MLPDHALAHQANAPVRAVSEAGNCPVCGTPLTRIGREISTDELFGLWASQHRFTREVVAEHVAQSESTSLHACPACGLEIFLPQIIGTPAFYESLIDDPAAEYYVPDKWDFTEALKDAAGCRSAIELGCGPGFFLQQLTRVVPDACGTEFNSRALAQARSKGLTVFGANEAPEGHRGTFDAVFSFHVLEHVASPMAFLRELVSWVRPGGIIGVSVPDADGPLRFIEPCIQNMPPHHATRWRRSTFQHAADGLGLALRRVALEPLILRDHYYYSTYWVQRRWPKATRLHGRIRRLLGWSLPPAFRWLFAGLGVAGKQSCGLLRGQAIYVLLCRPEA